MRVGLHGRWCHVLHQKLYIASELSIRTEQTSYRNFASASYSLYCNMDNLLSKIIYYLRSQSSLLNSHGLLIPTSPKSEGKKIPADMCVSIGGLEALKEGFD